MAKSTILNVPTHNIGTDSTFSVDLPYLNWDAFARVSESPEELILTSKDAPLDCPLIVKRSIQKVRNIYSGSNIDVAYQQPYRRGVSFVTALDCSATTTDPDAPTYRVDAPLHVHVVVRVPVSGDLPAALVMDALRTAVGMMFNQLDPTDINAVGDPMRGILTPISMQG